MAAKAGIAETAEAPKYSNTELEVSKRERGVNSSESNGPAGRPDESKAGEPPDWWKWLIVLCNFAVTWFSIGLNYGMWLILDDLRSFYDDYNYDQESVDIKWMVYINIFMAFFFGIFAAPLAKIDENCPRITVFCGAALSTIGLFVSWFATNTSILCVTYGCITGVGFGLMLTPSLGMIPRYFNRRRLDVGNSLAFLGASTSVLYMPPLLESVRDYCGRRGLFVILACMNAQLLVFSLLLRPIRQCEENYDGNQDDDYDDEIDGPAEVQRKSKLVLFLKYLDLSLFKKLLFSFMVVAEIFIGMGHNILILHLEQNAMAAGISQSESEWLPFTYGISMVVGLLVSGFCCFSECCGDSSDRDTRFSKNKVRLITFGLSLGIPGLAGILNFLSSSFGGYIAISIVIGFCCGFYLPLMVTLVKVFVHRGEGRENHAKSRWRVLAALGFALPAFGVGALIGLPLGDLLNEKFDNYRSSYFLAGAALLSADFIVMIRGAAALICSAGQRISKKVEGMSSASRYEEEIQMGIEGPQTQSVNIITYNYEVHKTINIQNAGYDNVLNKTDTESKRPKLERAQSTPRYL